MGEAPPLSTETLPPTFESSAPPSSERLPPPPYVSVASSGARMEQPGRGVVQQPSGGQYQQPGVEYMQFTPPQLPTGGFGPPMVPDDERLVSERTIVPGRFRFDVPPLPQGTLAVPFAPLHRFTPSGSATLHPAAPAPVGWGSLSMHTPSAIQNRSSSYASSLNAHIAPHLHGLVPVTDIFGHGTEALGSLDPDLPPLGETHAVDPRIGVLEGGGLVDTEAAAVAVELRGAMAQYTMDERFLLSGAKWPGPEWKGVRVLGQGGQGFVGLWEKYDENGNVVDSVAVKDIYYGDVGYRVGEQCGEWLIMTRLTGGPETDTCWNFVWPRGYVNMGGARKHRLLLEYCPYGDLHGLIQSYRIRYVSSFSFSSP